MFKKYWKRDRKKQLIIDRDYGRKQRAQKKESQLVSWLVSQLISQLVSQLVSSLVSSLVGSLVSEFVRQSLVVSHAQLLYKYKYIYIYIYMSQYPRFIFIHPLQARSRSSNTSPAEVAKPLEAELKIHCTMRLQLAKSPIVKKPQLAKSPIVRKRLSFWTF